MKPPPGQNNNRINQNSNDQIGGIVGIIVIITIITFIVLVLVREERFTDHGFRVDHVEIPKDHWEPEEIMHEFEVDQPPMRIAGDKPKYPESARDKRIQGTVITLLTVGVDGRAIDMQILRGIRGVFEEYFNQEIHKAVQTYRYVPAVHQGRPVPVKVQVSFIFRLE